jgi:hypothetical protein
MEKRMQEIENKNEDKEKEEDIISKVLPDGTIAEIIYDKEKGKTSLAICKNGKVEIKNTLMFNETILKPQLEKNIFKDGVVLLPSKPEEYESREKLVEEVQAFINKYLSVSPFFERVASYYVLFSWVHDDFNEVPYLRGLGDYGTGKSRFLQVVGSICYRPIFTGGATTVSPIFRILEELGGTLVLDEADFKTSDTTADIVKILNSGFMKNMPVLRSESNNKKGFDVKSFKVFGPKIIATREIYKDLALESRMITEDMNLVSTRSDISYNLPNSFEKEALELRNKLLMFRFKEKGTHKINSELGNPNIEPRLNQISLPLMSIIKDPAVVEEMKKYLEEYNEKIKNDRTLSYSYQVLDAIGKLLDEGYTEPTVQQITDEYNKELDYKEQIKPRKMGFFLGKVLNVKTKRDSRGFYLSMDKKNIEKISKLRERFGVPNNIADNTDVATDIGI